MHAQAVQSQIAAVLTGDIVASTRLTAAGRERLPDAIRAVEDRMAGSFPAYLPYALDFFRGDSWQWLVVPAGKSLRLAIFMRSLLLNAVPEESLDTRIAIGIGNVRAVAQGDLARGDGEAFRVSGELLEEFGRDDRMRVRLHVSGEPIDGEALDMVARLIDLQIGRWTKKQAHAISGAILGYTQQESANYWFEPSISQQAVAQHLDRAGWSSLEAGIRFFEKTMRS
jgi:hypothetical protein